ncbi:MAG TPA: hypothetical protein DDZ51_03500 [Planctomycetaceae bacterium]|nr:hypothetical protein [Planctomycetaceae bacterium]
MEKPPPKSLSLAEFETLRVHADLGNDQAKQQLATIIRQNPAHFAGLLDMKAVCVETMSRALSGGDPSLKADIDKLFAERLRSRDESTPPANVMQRMLVDVAAITDLRAMAFATHSHQAEFSEETSNAFMAVANKAQAASGILWKKLHWRPTPIISGGPPLRMKPKRRISGGPRNFAP